MLWMHRPPYARWAATAAIVALALVVDLRDTRTELRPFAAENLDRGQVVTDSAIVWRPVAVGLIADVDPVGKVAVRDIGRGEPVTSSSLADHRVPPDGWWSVDLALPSEATPGREARVVVDDPPLSTEAIVVSVESGGAFSASASGLVAVPARYADEIARASARSRAVVLLSP